MAVTNPASSGLPAPNFGGGSVNTGQVWQPPNPNSVVWHTPSFGTVNYPTDSIAICKFKVLEYFNADQFEMWFALFEWTQPEHPVPFGGAWECRGVYNSVTTAQAAAKCVDSDGKVWLPETPAQAAHSE